MKRPTGGGGVRRRGLIWRLRQRFASTRGETGFTLIEILIAVSIFGFLLGTTSLVMSTLLQVTSRVTTTYLNVDQQLWLSTNLQRLVRSSVAPAPSFTGDVPIPSFTKTTKPTPTSMTFYTNLGTSLGPVKVVAKCTVTATNHTLCAKASSLTVTVAHPTATSKCPFSTISTTTCTWTTPPTTLVKITGLRNGTNGKPLFVYAWRTITTTTTANVHNVCVPTAGVKPTSATSPCTYQSTGSKDTTDTNTFGTCAAATTGKPTFSKCKVGDIASVTYDIEINSKKSTLYGGSQAEDDTGIFALSPTSHLYDPTVG